MLAILQFFFFSSSQTFYIPQAAEHQKKEPTLIKSNRCVVTLSGKEARCLALKVVGLK